ncbi:integrin alpha-L [Larimichthys crocea]|uniref:integrin alpha-L n=1 Tax=Larimichthys crocea TaxID=215358 RepID=UPI0009019D58|nr:integrin alpha-L [Larimichthys crocea]
MYGLCRIFLLTYMVTVAIPVSLAFNLDMTPSDMYSGEQKDFYGYKVLQFKSGTNKGIIVTAPLNGSGEICKHDKSEKPKCFTPKDISFPNKTIPVKHFGLSIAEDSTLSQFTVCSPSVAHECYDNSYLNSVCYKMTAHLQPVSSITPNFQECKKQTVDLAFLFDGSGSMTEEEFHKNKDFIVDIMKNLSSSSIKFAAVQFSSDYRKVFDFNDYQAGTALDKLMKEPHMKKLTNTHKALKFVLEQIFENPGAGATPDATKVLVIITDGDPSDADRHGIIKKYDEKHITRFVIGVKDAKMDKFRLIASEPKDQNAFKIENYEGLTGILEDFQKKIFKMEGSKVSLAEDLTNELSQSGFSAIFHKDTLILGSVGSNGWRGSLQEIRGEKQTQIEDSMMKNASYMGYSVSVGERNSAPLYFTGAPRFEHIGQVVLFKHNGEKWTAFHRENGEQIGSYFGAELCSVDINSDGNTDFLLVGAPLFFHPQERREGQIYVYKLTDESKPLKSQLNITAPSMGRFGTTIASLADLNGDGLRDVAIGAPLEDDNRGAVYIFLGDKNNGMRSTFSQRIMGQKIKPGLRFFGQAIAGEIDLGEDGLPDIVIGSQGMAVVLRSRPVFNVTAHLSFEPKVISIEKIDCVGTTDENLPMVTLTACFEIKEATKSKQGAMSSRLNITYMLDVDPARAIYRGFFSKTDKKARNHTSNHELLKYTCFNHSIYMPKCVKDTLSPISIKLNFSQVDSESASAVLNMDSKRQAEVEVPFEKQCRTNDTCIAELEVDFNFMTPTLLITEDNYFNVSVQLSNRGDDSYNTSLSMHYPPGLSFSTMVLTRATRPMHPSCHDLDDLDKTICGISLPVFRSKSDGTFKISFHVMNGYKWNDTVSMTITGQSENMNTTIMGNSKTKSIPVQFAVKLAVTVSEDTISYLNFTPEDVAPKKLVTVYKIDNTGWKSFPVRVSLVFPTKLEHNFEMKNPQVFVEQNKTQCTNSLDTSDTMSEYCSPEKHCQKIVCDNFILDKESATEFRLSGDVQFIHPEERANKFLTYYTGDVAEVKFKSFIHVRFDKQRFVLDSFKQEEEAGKSGSRNDNDPTKKSKQVRVELIISPWETCIIATGAGLGFLLLLIITFIMFKMGCFKRKTLEYYQEQEEEAELNTGTPTKSDQSLEDKTLLEENCLPTTIEVEKD